MKEEWSIDVNEHLRILDASNYIVGFVDKRKMKNLYKLDVYFGRMGTIRGMFLAEPEQIEKTKGMEVNLGEALGKHSEVIFELEDKFVTLVTDDQEFIAKAIELKIVPFGHNPLNSIQLTCEDELCGERYDYDDGNGKCWSCKDRNLNLTDE